MASNLKLANAGVNEEADAFGALFDGGYLRIYDGAQPATADTEVTTQVLLAELTFGSPAFGAAVSGVITANAITKDSSANASGTAAWFRCVASDGTTKLMDGSVGTSGCDLNLNSVAISAGAEVSVTSFEHTVTKA
jgi:hypothetical protein